jgi:uncharacterized Zn ribbon protein
MNCFKCESKQDAAFFKEVFPCLHCEEENLIEYNICPDCGWMWRSVNGVPMDDSQMHIQDLGDFAGLMMGEDPPEMTEEEASIMENITDHLSKIDKMERGEASMSDYVHKCLRCESTAVDVNDGKYICRDCDFEWEVVRFD